jgi:crotonobetainyl-CoA:carnitine CoA-transferase CaiB-like acyl-CoA transferase
MKKRPLEGVRIADLSMMWAGPYATKLLAEMGAEVINVESPRAWDNIRTLLPQPGVATPWNSAFYFNEYNRDKKSVVLDLADERGRDVFLRLVAHCDIVLENYRADVLDKLGLGYDVLKSVRPDVILVSMAAFGKVGADRDRVGFGPVIEMMSGLVSLSGYAGEDEPFKTGISYGDPVAGVYAAGAVALALVKRHRTGEGSCVDLAQREGASLLAGEAFVRASLHGETQPAHLGNRSDRWAPQGVYRCAGDDEWVVVSVVTDDEWRACATSIGRPDLAELRLDERRARHDELDEVIGAWSAPLDPRLAVDVLQAAGVPAGRVLDMRTIKDDPHLFARGFWIRIPNEKMHPYRKHGVVWRLLEANPTIRRHAPYLGADNRDVLTAVAGLTEAEIDQLEADGIIADTLGQISYG